MALDHGKSSLAQSRWGSTPGNGFTPRGSNLATLLLDPRLWVSCVRQGRASVVSFFLSCLAFLLFSLPSRPGRKHCGTLHPGSACHRPYTLSFTGVESCQEKILGLTRTSTVFESCFLSVGADRLEIIFCTVSWMTFQAGISQTLQYQTKSIIGSSGWVYTVWHVRS